jgi:hypothetical protein
VATAGLDVSPLATLISRARTWGAPAAARRDMVLRARAISEEVLAEGKAARRAGPKPRERKVSKAQREVLSGAFEPHMHREVEALAAAVDGEKGEQREVLRAVLSSIVVKVSKQGGERSLARGMAARLFAVRAEELSVGLAELWRDVPEATPKPIVIDGDARAYRGNQDRVFDAILTSPPYPGTYDYSDNQKLQLALLGEWDRSFERREMGARRRFTEEHDRAIFLWEEDFRSVLKQLKRMLRPKSKIVFLMGDSVVGTPARSRAIFVEDTIGRLAMDEGLEALAGAAQERDKLGSMEVKAFGKRPKLEHLVMFTAM